jgi:hypothetical protein
LQRHEVPIKDDRTRKRISVAVRSGLWLRDIAPGTSLRVLCRRCARLPTTHDFPPFWGPTPPLEPLKNAFGLGFHSGPRIESRHDLSGR